MLAGSVIHDSFAVLVAYMMREGAAVAAHPHETLNILNDADAVTEMEDVARQSKRVKRPAWHLYLSFRPDELAKYATDEERCALMHRAAKMLIEELQLSDRQVLIVSHWDEKAGLDPGDRPYEVHIALNRASFEGKVVESSCDFARVETAAAKVAKNLQLLQVPGRFNHIQADPTNPLIAVRRENPYPTSKAAKSVQDRTGELTISQEILGNGAHFEALKQARRAGNWQVFITALNAQDLGLAYGEGRENQQGKPISPGLVLFDLANPSRRQKISSLDSPSLKWGMGSLVSELGQIPAHLIAERHSGATLAKEPLKPRNIDRNPVEKPRGDSELHTRFLRKRDEMEALSAQAKQEFRAASTKAWQRRKASQIKLSKSRYGQKKWARGQRFNHLPITVVVALVASAFHLGWQSRIEQRYLKEKELAYANFINARQPPLKWSDFKRAEAVHIARTATERAAEAKRIEEENEHQQQTNEEKAKQRRASEHEIIRALYARFDREYGVALKRFVTVANSPCVIPRGADATGKARNWFIQWLTIRIHQLRPDLVTSADVVKRSVAVGDSGYSVRVDGSFAQNFRKQRALAYYNDVTNSIAGYAGPLRAVIGKIEDQVDIEIASISAAQVVRMVEPVTSIFPDSVNIESRLFAGLYAWLITQPDCTEKTYYGQRLVQKLGTFAEDIKRICLSKEKSSPELAILKSWAPRPVEFDGRLHTRMLDAYLTGEAYHPARPDLSKGGWPRRIAELIGVPFPSTRDKMNAPEALIRPKVESSAENPRKNPSNRPDVEAKTNQTLASSSQNLIPTELHPAPVAVPVFVAVAVQKPDTMDVPAVAIALEHKRENQTSAAPAQLRDHAVAPLFNLAAIRRARAEHKAQLRLEPDRFLKFWDRQQRLQRALFARFDHDYGPDMQRYVADSNAPKPVPARMDGVPPRRKWFVAWANERFKALKMQLGQNLALAQSKTSEQEKDWADRVRARKLRLKGSGAAKARLHRSIDWMSGYFDRQYRDKMLNSLHDKNSPPVGIKRSDMTGRRKVWLSKWYENLLDRETQRLQSASTQTAESADRVIPNAPPEMQQPVAADLIILWVERTKHAIIEAEASREADLQSNEFPYDIPQNQRQRAGFIAWLLHLKQVKDADFYLSQIKGFLGEINGHRNANMLLQAGVDSPVGIELRRWAPCPLKHDNTLNKAMLNAFLKGADYVPAVPTPPGGQAADRDMVIVPGRK